MKNKFTARLCVLMCLVLIVSTFAACNIKGKNDNPTTTLAPDDSWQPGGNNVYEQVAISKVELVELVKDVLGDDAKDFNGDLNTLTPDQIQKVEDAAIDKGLIVDKDESGNTIIKKEEAVTTRVSQDEINNIMSKASVKDPSNLSPEEIEEISKIAGEGGMDIVTKPNGEIDIVKPVTTPTPTGAKPTAAPTAAPTAGGTQKPTEKTTSTYQPPTHGTVAPKPVTSAPIRMLTSSWVNTYSNSKNDVFADNAATSDNGVVSVGIGYIDSGFTAGIIAKHNEKGKLVWSDKLSGNDTTAYEGVAVLPDGSIIAVGYTMADNLVSDAEYKCKGTVEGVMVKYSAKGDRIWTKIIGGSAGDMLYSVAAMPDGSFIIGGKSESTDADLKDLGSLKIKAFMMKCDANGAIIWKNALSGSKHSSVEDMEVNSAGETFATLSCVSGDGEYAAIEGTKTARRTTVVLKLNAAGKIVWSKAIYDTGVTSLYAIALTADGGCVVAGQYSSSANGNQYSFKGIYNGGTVGTFDGMLVKLDSAGITKWSLPLIGFESDFVTGITKINGGFAVSGYSASTNRDFAVANKGNYDSFLYIITDYGKTQNVYSLGGSLADNARAICSTADSIFLSGSTNSGDVYFANCTPKGSQNVAVGYACRFAYKDA